MHESREEKYLGDQINKSGKHASILYMGRAKGYGIISDILMILEQIFDSKRKI